MAARKKAKALMSMADWEKTLAAEASQEAAQEKTEGGNVIGTSNGHFSYKGDVLGESMDVIVLASVFENAYYDKPYDPDNPAPPVCFALGDGEDMAPHENSPEPQADICADCELNEWGSAPGGGRGKACKNARRLAVMEATDDLEGAEIAQVRLAPTSLKYFSGYVKKLEKTTHRPVYGVVTQLAFDEDNDKLIIPDLVDKLNDPASLQIVRERRDEALELISQPYDASAYEQAEQRAKEKPSRRRTKKTAPKKKAGRRKF